MTCRHQSGDPACSSTVDGWRQNEIEQERREGERRLREKKEAEVAKERAEIYARTPDAEKYEIVDVTRIGDHLVMKVKYPNCSKCAYEGEKVMVFLNVTESDVLKWRRIDPHFRDPKSSHSSKEAPPPAARYPASPTGWADALSYAQGKVSEKKK